MSAISRKHSIDAPLDLRPLKRGKFDPDLGSLTEEDEFGLVFSTAEHYFWGEEYEKSLDAFQRAADLATDEDQKEGALLRAGEVIGLLYASPSGSLGLATAKLERVFEIFDQLFALGDRAARSIKNEVFFPWFSEILTFHDVKTKEELDRFLDRLNPLLALPLGSGAHRTKKVSAYLKEHFPRAELLSIGMSWVARYLREKQDINTLRAALLVLQIGLDEIDWRYATDLEKDAFFSHLFAKFVAFPDEKLSSCFSFISGPIPAHAEFDVEMGALSLFCDRFFTPDN